MNVIDLIGKKRDGIEHSDGEIQFLISQYVQGKIPDYQISAWLMAVFFKGLSQNELCTLTNVMTSSGERLHKKDKNEIWLDKHSTGGVGDKTSLILVPLVTTTCERVLGKGKVKIPMISGRGLGITGGTLDKLESISGFTSQISIEKAYELLEKNHFFMMGQTTSMNPADRLLYALRDVTATVESIPLIVSSIMSKKLGEGIDGLVLDVKVGEGSFMPTEDRAEELCIELINTAKKNKVDVVGVMTRMDEPLGEWVGNFVEIWECEKFLSGELREVSLFEVTMQLAAHMVVLATQRKITFEKALKEVSRSLDEKEALLKFQQMFESQGADWLSYEKQKQNYFDQMKRFEVKSDKAGYLSDISVRTMASLVTKLGGGRQKKEDNIDPLIAYESRKKLGQKVKEQEVIGVFYFRDEVQKELLHQETKSLYKISDSSMSKTKNNVVKVYS